jgi:hypothetical protein
MGSFFGLSVESSGNLPSIPPERLRRSLEILQPKPSPFPLIRIGGNSDGAYLVPDDLAGITDCLSPGVNNFKRFEDELASRYKIKCHLVDASSDLSSFATPLIPGLQTFDKLWLDVDGSNNSISIEEWMNGSAEAKDGDYILQMDIEGAEYRNLLVTPDACLSRFRIIVMELHHVDDGLRWPDIFAQVMEPLLLKLDTLFVCVHAHPNNCFRSYPVHLPGVTVPRLLELTFLRRDRISQRSLFKQAPIVLPHSLDIINVLDEPPLFLGKIWCTAGGGRIARVRIAREWLSYFWRRFASKVVRSLSTLLQPQEGA